MRSVHRTRVASRRLREVLPVLQIDPRTARKLVRSLRKITRRLGPVRDLDVLLLLATELQGKGQYSRRALGRVAGDLRRAQGDARSDLPVKKITTHLRRLERKLNLVAETVAGVDRETPPSGWRWALDARVARRAATLHAAIEEAGSLYLAERLHRVRIALKKLRYGLELRLEAAGARPNADLKTLKRAQDALGRLHDRQVLIDRVRAIQARLEPGEQEARRDLDSLLVPLEQSCRRLHGRYVREQPAVAAICDRMVARGERPARLRRVG